MILLKDIVAFLNGYLAVDEIDDSSWNGLQFEGSEGVSRIVLAVDAGIDTFERAREENAQMIVVHHGHFWKGENPSLTGWGKRRMDILYRYRLSLYACHLLLDRHEEVGNNALLLRMLEAPPLEGFIYRGRSNVGWIGERSAPITIGEVDEVLKRELNADTTVLPFGTGEIKRIAVCTGGGGYDGFYESLRKQVDLYITGDTVEVFHTAKDAGINVIFAGHHATEILGVRALAVPLQDNFGVETVFVDLPTGL